MHPIDCTYIHMQTHKMYDTIRFLFNLNKVTYVFYAVSVADALLPLSV